MKSFFLLCCVALWASAGRAVVAVRGNSIVVSRPGYAVALSTQNGSIVSVTAKTGKNSIWRSGQSGLWQARRRDNSVLRAADFSSTSAQRAFHYELQPLLDSVQLLYRSAEIDVTATVEARADGVEFRSVVTPHASTPQAGTPQAGTVLDWSLPARLRFEAENVVRFISPAMGHEAVGLALKSAFFTRQSVENPVGWQPENGSTQAHDSLTGGTIEQRPVDDQPVALRVTPQGNEWLGETLAQRVASTRVPVNRPSARAQVDLVLVDSANGPYFGASRLGGRDGALWRIGSGVREEDSALVADLVSAALRRVASEAAAQGAAPSAARTRRKIGLISLVRGPSSGGWAGVAVSQWRERLRTLAGATLRQSQVVEISSPEALRRALGSDEYAAILNPYGEWVPVWQGGDQAATAQEVGRFVRGGGHWFEVGGYSFYYALRRLRYLARSMSYPPAFADFLHLESRAGIVSLYGVQPQALQPQALPNTPARSLFVPGQLRYGGDESGGYCERNFVTFVNAGQKWQAPPVRLLIGASAPGALAAYARDNAITRRLADKMSPPVLDKFKNAVLLYLNGTARQKIDALPFLPQPTLLHFADYLKGGFDKEYPDHLPPNVAFGTPQQLRELFDRSHALGHLVMPYTNPTWWPDHPRGPTFLREGEAPLLRTLDGQLSYERYSANDGWTITMWHPAVKAANRALRRELTQQYPVDILFQDQVGARGWMYDTNPASPSPNAYTAGLLAQAAEDARFKPLSTENGWDQVINQEAQFCGLSWGVVPTEDSPSWVRQIKEDIPPQMWEVFPLAQYLAHDKLMFVHHDLGQFVTNNEVLAWTLGLGYGLSYRADAAAVNRDATREWLRWLDRVQKSVCARYIGQPITQWNHRRAGDAANASGELLRATYGPVSIVANLDSQTRVVDGHTLPQFGFRATAPGLIAASLPDGTTSARNQTVSFVAEKKSAGQMEVYLYAPAQASVAVPLAELRNAKVTLHLNDSIPSNSASSARVGPVTTAVENGVLRVRLPQRNQSQQISPAAHIAGKAPRQWLKNSVIGIVNFGPQVGWSWTGITPQDWKQAFDNSRLVREWGLTTKFLTTPQEVLAALRGEPQQYFAIINAHTEKFPTSGAGQWKATLEAVRHYVENGGNWWETGGYSFYLPTWREGNVWQNEAIGPSGMAVLGLPIGGGEVDAPAQSLRVTGEGREWLGNELSTRIESATSVVNRSLARGSDDPGHVTLVMGDNQDFIGGYRLNGWGWLWRIGGFNPNPQVALPVAVTAMEHLWNRPSQPGPASAVKYLWHFTVRSFATSSKPRRAAGKRALTR
ncbi:MAG TPA: hypothetical protein VF600_12430 [Abditibacteriaceae bacterium]|jgi:hypothetical protein